MLRTSRRDRVEWANRFCCGPIAIFLCLNYIAEGRDRFFWIAFLLHFVALVCDVIDGYWARRSCQRSMLGADLDSLADIVPFGVAPAVLGFTFGNARRMGHVDPCVLCCMRHQPT